MMIGGRLAAETILADVEKETRRTMAEEPAAQVPDAAPDLVAIPCEFKDGFGDWS